MPILNTPDNQVNSGNAAGKTIPGGNVVTSPPNAANPTTNMVGGKQLPAELEVKETAEGVKEYALPQAGLSSDPKDISLTFQSKVDNLNLEPKNVNLQFKNYTLEEILDESVRLGASDVHLTVGYRTIVRIDGKLQPINSNILAGEDLLGYVNKFLETRKNIDPDTITELDMGYSHKGTRFRVNIFKQMGNYSIVCRVIPNEIKSMEELSLPPILKEFATLSNGLVLVTGPTGNGKSTTIASILNHINTTQSKHLITLEDPIEFVFPKGLSLVDQREAGIDFTSWPSALRALLRQDPNVVLVGEMRDLETIASTITVSETGHLVFATLHTNSASQTIDRIIDVFPEAQQAQIRAQLANVISAVISQRLVTLQGGGRMAVLELMIATPAVRNAIREAKTYQIDNIIQTSQDIGMISMEKSLVQLVKNGKISLETAKTVSIRPNEIDILMKG